MGFNITSVLLGLAVGILSMLVYNNSKLNAAKTKANNVLEEANIQAKNTVKQAVLEGKTQVHELKLQAEKEIKEKAPVDTGVYRKSWRVSREKETATSLSSLSGVKTTQRMALVLFSLLSEMILSITRTAFQKIWQKVQKKANA